MSLACFDQPHGLIHEGAPVFGEGGDAALFAVLGAGRLQRISDLTPRHSPLGAALIALATDLAQCSFQALAAVIPGAIKRLNPANGVAVMLLVPGQGAGQRY